MGTRHLIAVQLDGKYRIAQYGQWDGYPSGQGADVLKFLRKMNRPKFEEKLRAASFCTDADWAEIKARIERDNLGGHNEQWKEVWPELSRDTGAKVLALVQEKEAGIKLRDQIDFAANSLMCEWGYVIDLDTNTLEVFKGFQKNPLPEGDRFANFRPTNPREAVEGYYQIRRIASYSLDKLPTQRRLERDCDPPDED
jgi:hypothetical protein